ncbi:long-chain fatty acid--CoA ligase [Sphingomonas lacunae]|uniref:Long-chain fatty acid--CoA ligase n=1 Tax=Sphingomonas lacunae TaxID=2698828 RepID=A0A6M4AZK0_9SPHN|nr:AMP-dependent synthetase/ligase [Sphingomonas lacunae]QJQ33519.1 long-chain fatty acid--CoA ligase [Sphingomonas lacunae]
MSKPKQIDGFPNLVSLFFTRANEGGDAPFLGRKVGREWVTLSWREVAGQVAALSDSLIKLGLNDGDRVVLVSENRPEWLIADIGIMAAGCVTVPTYTTNTERDHQHILDNSGARAVIVSTAKLARSVMPAALRANVEFVVVMEELRTAQQGDVRLIDWSDLVRDGEGKVAEAVERARTVRRGDLACLIYTSGTGGAPRGVQQHHGAILHNVEGAAEILDQDFGLGDEVFLSFLPLSHAYEHTGGQYLPIGVGAQIFYAEGLEKLVSNIEEVRPTIMVVVPRLFEVIRARMLKAVEKQGKAANFLLSQALKLGAKEYQQGLSLLDRPMNIVVDRLFRPKIAQRFGGRMKAMVAGGAPLNPEIGVFFQSLGMTLLQGYGQTEAGPVISCNRPRVGLKMDTVGPPLKNTEVRIAPDGEICVRGELVMHGYWRNEAETARVLVDGWLLTGDIGHIDEKGRIVITDRKKDIIVNDKGDNVSPQRVEGMLTLQPEIQQAMVHGDKRPHLVAIIVPDPEWALEWAKSAGLPTDMALLQQHDAFRTAIRAAVDRVNQQLSVIEKVRKFEFADEPFAIENEQMTPSLKIRRHVLNKVYSERIASMYRA